MSKICDRRCLIKLQVFSLMLVVFISIHSIYIHTVSSNPRNTAYSLESDVSSDEKEGVPKLLSKTVKRKLKSLREDAAYANHTCLHKRNYVFLKTHKTGSTTMNNILMRYAEKHELVVGLPPPRKWELAGYPANFNEKLIDPQLDYYNVLCHHFRMSKKAVSRIMPDDTVYITILRDPVNAFESSYSFFRDGPFSAWMPNYSEAGSLETFINNPQQYYNRETPWYFRAKNYQAFDLGFDNEKEDEKYINSVVQDMSSLYDLVLITERFDESLILLKDLLCMDSMLDLVHLRLKVRQNVFRRKTNQHLQEGIRSWNALDTGIYNHFVKVLDQRIQEYGKERMEKDVAQLNDLVSAAEKKCILEYDHLDLRPWISRIRLNKNAGEQCEKLSWGEKSILKIVPAYQVLVVMKEFLIKYRYYWRFCRCVTWFTVLSPSVKVRYSDYLRKKQLKYANIHPERQIASRDMINELENEQRKMNVF